MKTKIGLPGFLIAILFLSISLPGCKKERVKFEVTNMVGDGSGKQVVPEISTNASSTFFGVYSKGYYNLFIYTIRFKDLSGPWTKISINGPSSSGQNGPEIHLASSASPSVEGEATGSFNLNSIAGSQLLSGQWYYIILTTTHPEGEVRGQIIKE